jgi:hypothetical protein
MKPAAHWILGLAVGLLAACATTPATVAPPPATAPTPPPPPAADEDGTPQSPRPLGLVIAHVDTLERDAGDLDDWYRVEVPSAGTLRIAVDGEGGAPLRGLFVALTDLTGQFPGNPTRSGGRSRIQLNPAVPAGPRLLWIGSEAGTAGKVAYSVRVDFTPRAQAKPAVAKPPPAPAVTVFTSRVVEFAQGQGDKQFATIAGGTKAGLAKGMKGRLLDGGRVIGSFEVVDVYPAGSKVQIQGKLAAPITGQTVVEVDVPK